ncbi:MAG: hypothetical protein BJ554DRAFT_4005 [Olpidium bornovanus]|uniref:Uncharacterized protein n=1 Tax=Olpidium bornovanus TaxID=278681 RepID=A0A8H8DFE4_9FUNG|nr:MAG: hypothetical protein BJ554DRAFT_4005 [Olpidium bornovanus]
MEEDFLGGDLPGWRGPGHDIERKRGPEIRYTGRLPGAAERAAVRILRHSSQETDGRWRVSVAVPVFRTRRHPQHRHALARFCDPALRQSRALRFARFEQLLEAHHDQCRSRNLLVRLRLALGSAAHQSARCHSRDLAHGGSMLPNRVTRSAGAFSSVLLLTSPDAISSQIPVSMVAESAINNRTMSALYFLGAFLVIIGFVLVNLAAFFDNDKAGRAKKDEAATVHTDPDPKPVADVI